MTDARERRPRVSIGLPVYNGEQHVRAAIEAILAQTYRDFVLLVSDNASSDRTEAICREFAARDPRVHYFRNPVNIGVVANFNRTFELSRSEYFIWAAHDDVMAPELLAECVQVLDADAKAVLCVPRRQTITGDGHPIFSGGLETRERECFRRVSFARLVRLHGSAAALVSHSMFRSAVLAKTRLFMSFTHSDCVFVAEMRMLGEFAEAPSALFYQRLYDKPPSDRSDARKRRAWIDPSTRSEVPVPDDARLLVEYLKAIERMDLPAAQKRRYVIDVVTQTAARFGDLARDRAKALVFTRWLRVQLMAIELAERSSLPLRLVALVSSIALRNRKRFAIATEAWSDEQKLAVWQFAAERLRGSMDPASSRRLAEWLTEDSDERRLAAAQALARPTRHLVGNLTQLFGSQRAAEYLALARRLTSTASPPTASVVHDPESKRPWAAATNGKAT